MPVGAAICVQFGLFARPFFPLCSSLFLLHLFRKIYIVPNTLCFHAGGTHIAPLESAIFASRQVHVECESRNPTSETMQAPNQLAAPLPLFMREPAAPPAPPLFVAEAPAAAQWADQWADRPTGGLPNTCAPRMQSVDEEEDEPPPPGAPCLPSHACCSV